MECIVKMLRTLLHGAPRARIDKSSSLGMRVVQR
jgi:hypothetical protein